VGAGAGVEVAVRACAVAAQVLRNRPGCAELALARWNGTETPL